jgi:hypothetical protein
MLFLACFVFTQHKQANSFRMLFSAHLFKLAVASVKIFAFDCLAVLSHFDFDFSDNQLLFAELKF